LLFEKYNKISVIGAARSGIAVSKLLKSKGYSVLLSDSGDAEKIYVEFIDKIRSLNIDYEFGKHSEKIFECDLMVVSPGVSQNSELIRKANEKKIDVVSEIEAASWFAKGKLLAITGTNGKTTTTMLTGKIFEDAGYKTFVCGNIGVAFSEIVEQTDDESIIVLETSSFQLDNIKSFKPLIASLINITPDHLDRYENSADKYADSKKRIAENQDENNFLVYNSDDEVVIQKVKDLHRPKRVPVSISEDLSNVFDIAAYLDRDMLTFTYELGTERILDRNELSIKGEHNVYNSLFSIANAKLMGVASESVRKSLKDFKGVEHRLEFVRDVNGVKFYNDSKATNVNSVWYAIRGFDVPLVLILGGKDKGNDYSLIENEVKKHVKQIVAVGESKMKVYEFFRNICPVIIAKDFEDCIYKAATEASKNEVVLFSPACASFDMFENFEHRGKEFKRIVNSL